MRACVCVYVCVCVCGGGGGVRVFSLRDGNRCHWSTLVELLVSPSLHTVSLRCDFVERAV